MLKIWILNVGHGDSIVLEYTTEEGKAFGLIDSNHTGGGEPRALTKLRELGANQLSFIALTHPHADHYTGLAQVLEAYEGNVNNFFSYPIGHDIHARFDKLVKTYAKFHSETESPTAKNRAIEFVKILSLVKENIGLDNWQELSGYRNQIMPQGFVGVEIFTLLPPAKVKGYYFQLIDKSDTSIVGGRDTENKLSLAFLIRYQGQEVVLGGDGTGLNWLDHRREWQKGGIQLNAKVAKLPHHGSKLDCSVDVLKHIFSSDQNTSGVLSANGQSHPHSETYSNLETADIKPYCTNLSKQCGANIKELISIPEAAPILRRVLNSIGESTSHAQQPCQGDILICMNNNSVTIDTQYNHPCPYRGGYNDLFQI